MDEIFPNGVTHYLLGGALIGVGVSLIFATTGVRAGASGVLTAAFSWGSKRAAFQQYAPQRNWRVVFSLGLILGALVISVTTQLEQSPTQVPLWKLGVGGLLVGLGTRSAKGCTSGHGICGLSSMSPHSLVHVLTFMGVAMITANLLRSLS